MGFNVSVISCALGDKTVFLAACGWHETDEPDPEYRAPRSGGVLGDRFLIWENWRRGTHTKDPKLVKVSQSVDVLVSFVSESTMWSETALFSGGSKMWSISHASEVSPDDLQVTGSPPEIWREIAEKQRKQAAEDDDEIEADHLFDAPPLLFAALTGFKYDHMSDLDFHAIGTDPVLAKKPFWRFWG